MAVIAIPAPATRLENLRPRHRFKRREMLLKVLSPISANTAVNAPWPFPIKGAELPHQSFLKVRIRIWRPLAVLEAGDRNMFWDGDSKRAVIPGHRFPSDLVVGCNAIGKPTPRLIPGRFHVAEVTKPLRILVAIERQHQPDNVALL